LVAELWGKRAERAAALLAKGARVRVEGTLVQDSWVDKESQEERIKFKLKLDWIALDPIRIDSVRFKESSRARREAANEADAAP
jgi:single-strand DNA-binding protein